jgi:hypothetical protein
MTRTGTVSVAGSTFIVTQAGDTTRPFVNITGPPANARFTNDQITLSGTASDDRGVARVEYQLGTNQPQTASGTTTWTAPLELVPGTNTVQVRCFDLAGNVSTNSTRNFYFSRVSLTKGSYNGLFHEPDAVRFHSSGFFRLVVTDKGTYSGSLRSGGKTYPITGRFDPDGTATNAIVRNGTNVLGLAWTLDMQALNAVSGTVNGPNWQATLAGDRAQLNAITNPAWQAGKYTLVIAGHEGATNEPAGDGFGTAKVDRNGKVTFSGALAEGTKLVQSVPTSKDGRWPLFASLYTAKGAVISWLSFDPVETNRLTGALNWFKPPLPASKFYTNGLDTTNLVVGSRYLAPIGATNRILSITNGTVVFDGATRLEPLTNAVILGRGSRVTNASPNKLTLTFTLASGVFNGTFIETGTVKRVLFKGAVLQNMNHGSGFFLDTNLSGRILLQASP